ncbi:MAG: hypothetical protein ACNA8W_26330, partial [Bradymonadaceae bacterium]
MDGLWRGLLLALLISSISWSAAAQSRPSHDPLPFPAPSFLQETFFGELLSLVEDESWICDGEKRRSCACVAVERPEFEILIPSWGEEDGKTIWTDVRLMNRRTGARYYLERVILGGPEEAVRIKGLIHHDKGFPLIQ